MKINDFIFHVTAQNTQANNVICRIRTFVNKKQESFVLITSIRRKNAGGSITNTIEHIKDQLLLEGHANDSTKIIEHWEKMGLDEDTFDLVTFDSKNTPDWARIDNINGIYKILECDREEFKTPTLQIKQLYDKIEKIRYSINPYIDEPEAEPYEVVNRREDIRKNRLPIEELSTAIKNKAGERELQSMIDSDLSIIGDIYATLPEEYICFSQFPIDNGFVDFVVFSGRSRMDVTLIEIKGADYNLINQGNYQNLSSKTNEAAQQLRNRYQYISQNYQLFKRTVHEIREDVESGKQRYKSFMGPQGNLLVSSRKDINIHTVLIGGKSQDDYSESKERQAYESAIAFPFKLESWDSWIKKIPR